MIPNQLIAPLKILLADDDKDDRIFFSQALQETSNATEINIVNDGEELMNYLTEHTENIPDIIFLDLNMPRKNGFECLTELKESIKLKDIYVIIFSTSFPRDIIYEDDMIKRLLKIGAEDYIRKSNSYSELKQVIRLAITKAIEIKSHRSQQIII
jgi:CheY-like chemotaxis protein